MPDNEGSVSFENDFNEDDIFDGEGDDSTNEGQDDGQDQNINNNQNGEGEGDGGNDDGSQNGDQNGDQNSGKTDKGTNLANDPIQRANQLRANAEAKFRQAMQYIRQLEEKANNSQSGNGKQDELFLDPSKIETREDLQKFADSLLKVVGQKNQELEGKLKQTTEERQFEQTKNKVLGGIQEVQSKYPVFREYNLDGTKNPSYDPELDKALSDLYKELDFDPESNFYRGKVSIMRLAETIMNTSKRGEATGSQNAQTKVIDKRQGAVSGGQPSNAKQDESKMTVGGLFAQRVQEAVKNRGRR